MTEGGGLKTRMIVTPEMEVAKEMGAEEEGAIPSRYTSGSGQLKKKKKRFSLLASAPATLADERLSQLQSSSKPTDRCPGSSFCLE